MKSLRSLRCSCYARRVTSGACACVSEGLAGLVGEDLRAQVIEDATAHPRFKHFMVLNGGLNLSVLDGWWAEAYDGRNGFAIGRGETPTSIERHDARDADALVRVLRDEVIPLYHDRDSDGLPAGGSHV